jgi:hypothetical protein
MDKDTKDLLFRASLMWIFIGWFMIGLFIGMAIG